LAPSSARCAEFFAKRKVLYDHRVSTRRLILAAVLCALAILGAGVAFFVRTAANKDKLTVSDVYRVGEPGRINGVQAKVVASEVSATLTTVTVEVTPDAASPELADIGRSFVLATGSTVTRPRASDRFSSLTSCEGLAAKPGVATTCSMVFDVIPTRTYFVSFAGPLGGQLQWRLRP
jgi:hypothetical protein